MNLTGGILRINRNKENNKRLKCDRCVRRHRKNQASINNEAFFAFYIDKLLPLLAMISIRHLVQLWALVSHTVWRGVAPSPTDEGALRGGHGDHGEPGHKEHHKDSYGTFASEFPRIEASVRRR